MLAKGNPPLPRRAISDVQRLEYTGNALHPTQKAISALAPIIRAFTQQGDLVLDSFCGSASTCAAALLTGRRFLGVELDGRYFQVAVARLERIRNRIAAKRSRSFPLARHYARVPVAPQDALMSSIVSIPS